MANFKVRAGSVSGALHHQRWSNCQDKYRLASCRVAEQEYLFGIVSDGCSEASNSEVGAALLAEFGVLEVARLLKAGFGPQDVPDQLYRGCLKFIQSICELLNSPSALPDERQAQIADYWLATIVGFVLGEEVCVGFVAGDGFILVNDTLHDYHTGPAPDYLAYELLEDCQKVQPAGFKVVELATADLERLAVWTDGFSPELLPALAQLGKGSRALQRQLNIWADRNMLADDTTGILVEREHTKNEDQS